MDLLARRADIIARHKILESVGGSGWHRKDAGSPHMLDQMPLSERPIGFVGDDEVLFVGEDVDTVKQGLAKFAARYEGQEIPEDAAQLIRTLKAVPGQMHDASTTANTRSHGASGTISTSHYMTWA